MASYIGKVQIGDGDQVLIGSTLYGICGASVAAENPAKIVTLPEFDALNKGITVQVRFINGNSVINGVTLKVGSTDAYPVQGNCVCSPDDVISFTFDQDGTNTFWYVNRNIVVQEGSTNGTIKIAGQDVRIHGLGTAAYENINSFATAEQGQKADNAMPKSGGTFTGPVTLNADPTAAMHAATKGYVDTVTAGLSELTTPMSFIGTTPAVDEHGTPILPDDNTSFITYNSGDVILVGQKEYVYSKGNTAENSTWILLGDEGSYALKSSRTTINNVIDWDAGSVPELGTPIDIDDLFTWNPGSTTSAEVQDGVLKISHGSAPTLASTGATIPNVISVGTLPSLSKSSVIVIIPDNAP